MSEKSALDITTTVVTETLTTSETVTETLHQTPPTDDLQLAIFALTASPEVALSATGKLLHVTSSIEELSTTTTSTFKSSDDGKATRALAIAGAKRLSELTHGNEDNKSEALDRGILSTLALTASMHQGHAAVTASIAKATRTVCFKHEAARNEVASSGILSALLRALTTVVTDLRNKTKEESINDELGALDELCTTLVALTNGHAENTEIAKETGTTSITTSAIDYLTSNTMGLKILPKVHMLQAMLS